MATSTAKPWRFYRAGGLDQVRIENGADIAALGKLDRKLWVALACPVKGLEFDERTLALIDADGDGRVRASEIVGAVEFLTARLKTLDTLLASSDALVLSDINEATPEGHAALASAKRILANLGREGADSIAFSDIAAPEKFFVGTLFNGDGVVTPESAESDEATAAVLRDIIATHGSTPDRSGNPGVDRARIETFFAEARSLDEWLGTASKNPALLPFGEGTAAAYAAVTAVKAKVDDYFARTRVAAFDARALEAVNRAEEDYLKAAASDLSVTAQEMAGFPLARIEASRPLPLASGLNPAWAGAIAELRRAALAPMLGNEPGELTESQWTELNAKLAAHAAWATGRPATQLGSLGDARIQGLLKEGAQDKVMALLQRDEALKDETSGMDAVEKLVRLNRDFVRLLHNFVSFGDFYSRKRAATFQDGHLFLDSRECTLCIRVDDPGKHAVLASLSKCYLAYCDLSRRNPAGATETMSVLAVFTQGDSDYLTVGRNGLFIDRKGDDWDATITKIVDAPISIRQAFFAPYKKFVRMIEEQVAKRAAAADAAADAQLASHAQSVAHVDKSGATAPAAAAPAAPAKKIDLGTIALIGTAISGVAAMVGLVLEKFFGLGIYMPLGILAIILLISGPSMLIAALKLRQRSLGPILDAGGWAINGRVRVNIPFGVALTSIAKLPAGSTLSLQDPFEEKKSPWPMILVVLAVLLMAGYGAYRQGWLDRWLPEKWDVAKPAPAGQTATTPAAPAP
jgi:hypothetical protein